MKVQEHCPGCGSSVRSNEFRIRKQPVVLNYRFRNPAASRKVKRRDMVLLQCGICGLVSNRNFDPAIVPYDENYENRQSFSPAFNLYLRRLAQDLIKRNRLSGKRILEIGCGKGDFLRLTCHLSGGRGLGFDTTYEGPRTSLSKRVRFFPHYVSEKDIKRPYDAIVCRHVVEHVPAIQSFLQQLHAIAVAAGHPLVAIETPTLEWIVENGCFLDLFYEHCNYFPMPCLAYLCESAGFKVLRHQRVFKGQYQLIELKPEASQSIAIKPPRIPKSAALQTFPRVMLEARRKLESRLLKAGAAKGWAVWGAGGKGVALVNQLGLELPRFVVDANPAKHGCVIPGTPVPIISPDDDRVLDVPLILIVNPNYAAEIKALLKAKGFGHALLSL